MELNSLLSILHGQKKKKKKIENWIQYTEFQFCVSLDWNHYQAYRDRKCSCCVTKSFFENSVRWIQFDVRVNWNHFLIIFKYRMTEKCTHRVPCSGVSFDALYYLRTTTPLKQIWSFSKYLWIRWSVDPIRLQSSEWTTAYQKCCWVVLIQSNNN